jgi:hypothetical protein
MLGGSVYKHNTFNKETAHTSHENSTNTSHEFSQYNTKTSQNTAEKRNYRRKQNKHAVRKRTLAIKPIVRRYIV